MKKILKWAGIAILVLIVIGGLSGSGKSSTTGIQQSTVNTSGENSQVPTTSKGKVEVKSHSRTIEYGYPKVVGEVVNNTSKTASFVKVTATYYDAQGKVVGTDFTYAGDTASTPLEQNLTAPFQVTHLGALDYATYKLDVSWQ
jgi:hypothetical protein